MRLGRGSTRAEAGLSALSERPVLGRERWRSRSGGGYAGRTEEVVGVQRFDGYLVAWFMKRVLRGPDERFAGGEQRGGSERETTGHGIGVATAVVFLRGGRIVSRVAGVSAAGVFLSGVRECGVFMAGVCVFGVRMFRACLFGVRKPGICLFGVFAAVVCGHGMRMERRRGDAAGVCVSGSDGPHRAQGRVEATRRGKRQGCAYGRRQEGAKHERLQQDKGFAASAAGEAHEDHEWTAILPRLFCQGRVESEREPPRLHPASSGNGLGSRMGATARE